MSGELWEVAKSLFPGGVNSPVRAKVQPYPFYVRGGQGPYIFTEEGKALVDFVLGYGPLFLGHNPPYVRRAVERQLERGWLFGTPSRAEVELARKIRRHVPSMEKMRFVNSGTEATMVALRLARGYTGRTKVLKFDGNYHGAHDYVLIDAGSAASEYGVPTSAGVPEEVTRTVSVCPYNDLSCVQKILSKEDHAAVIVEPVMGNMGVIPPSKGFLSGLREICSSTGTLLIFDEVITGFRLSISGAQGLFGVNPDITTLGKIVGGGFPIGVVGGRKEIMDQLTPSGPVFNAGTFNAHPLSMAAGVAVIEQLENGNHHVVAERAAKAFVDSLDDSLKLTHVVNRVGSMFQVFLGVSEVRNASQARKADREAYLRLHSSLLREGVFIPPSQFEALFTSAAHDQDVVDFVVRALRNAVRSVG
ncbi:glutamate-1-semialdehyde-2,1-aminomutase [Sulfodiicoccus acidiphilus]|uniref:Glutamate-1-semialdehyde 2,1-aminomutase n=1 Tax=Sulfodiicoccus acidiphilus TaxID=1670455 RepID=A0A348B2W0_9CREN|nr:glutamate-1-semialdehyde-2,1-aminomutase [Sulfodiicoccus acidiphilus]GGT94010.1 glutamate-1-semialdehyde-2,1-aminomutase [Sulfodiicoccus acidiphilus]